MITASQARRFVSAETKNSYFITSAIIALVFFVYAVRFPSPPFFGGDAEQYWKLGATFFTTGSFSLAGGEQTYRGYLLPLIFGIFQHIGALTRTNPFFFFYATNAVFTALSLAVVIPMLVDKLFDVRIKVWQIFLFSLMFLLFWRGYLLEPLSDSWSLFLILTAIMAIIYTPGRPFATGVGLAFISGLCLGAAINFRPIYLICAPLYAIGLFFLIRDRLAEAQVRVLAAALGFVIMLLPQAVINQHFLGSWNPFIHSGSLYVLQLFFGLAVQRHECAYFIDPSGIELLKLAGSDTLLKQPDGSVLFALDVSQRSIAQYLDIVLARPLDTLFIYVRHGVNGLTLLGSNVYYCMPGHPRYLLNFASLIIILVAATAALLVPPRLGRRHYHAFALIPLVPIGLTIPTAMEGRFFLPLHLGAYAFLCFLVSWHAMREAVWRHARIVIPAFLLICLLAGTVVASTFASTLAWIGASKDGVLLRPVTILIQQ